MELCKKINNYGSKYMNKNVRKYVSYNNKENMLSYNKISKYYYKKEFK